MDSQLGITLYVVENTQQTWLVPFLFSGREYLENSVGMNFSMTHQLSSEVTTHFLNALIKRFCDIQVIKVLLRASSTLKMIHIYSDIRKISFNIIIIITVNSCLLHCTYWEIVEESLLFGEAIFGLSKMAVLSWQHLLSYLRLEKKSFSKVN